MKFWQAMQAYAEGKSVRCDKWEVGDYVNVKTSNGWLVFQRDVQSEWEVFEPLLGFSEVIQGLKEGKKFARKGWDIEDYFIRGIKLILDNDDDLIGFTVEDFEAKDWYGVL